MSVVAFPFPAPVEPRLRRIGRIVAVGALLCVAGGVLAVPLLWSSDEMLRHWIATQSPLGARPFTLNLSTRLAGAAPPRAPRRSTAAQAGGLRARPCPGRRSEHPGQERQGLTQIERPGQRHETQAGEGKQADHHRPVQRVARRILQDPAISSSDAMATISGMPR